MFTSPHPRYLRGWNLSNLLLSVSLCACQHHSHTDIYSPSFAKAFNQPGHSFSQYRTPVSFSNGHTVSNCNDYLKNIHQIPLTESIFNKMAKSEYLYCEVAELLLKPKNPEYQLVSDDQLACRPISGALFHLDVRSFNSSLAGRCKKTHCTLRELFPHQIRAEKNKITIETTDWIYNFTIMAAAQINQNDCPDWIIQFSDAAKTGNYRGYSTLIYFDLTCSRDKADYQQYVKWPVQALKTARSHPQTRRMCFFTGLERKEPPKPR